jgi:NADH-quinone oxidoreductase subunit G
MADVKMVTLTIEGRAVSVPDGTSILEAAKYAGVLVPHYCYHPGLPVAGVCRMCLVEVEKAPKLAPSCATQAMEGQVVHVHSPKALEARKGVLEMLLINHPLDCPICDQSGECELQDYTYQEGRGEGRYRDPKRFNPVEDFGGDVMYVANRCILCTRCVRFMDDVAHDPVLSVAERGDRALIGKFEGQDLTHAWAGNVIDLCPVGALLSKDSLNKVRELDRSASVCPNCSQGCNMIVETRDNQVVRLRPRPNADVNAYFMCDHGRLNYRWMNRQDRVSTPMVRQNGVLASAEWEVALRAAATLLASRPAFVLASPMLSNEALFLLGKLVTRTGGSGGFRVEQGEEAPLPGVEDLALRADRAANVRGGRRAERDGRRRRRTRRGDHRDRDDPAGVGASWRECCPADRQHDGRGRNVHQPARPRAAVPAGEGGAWHRTTELLRDRRPAGCTGRRRGILDSVSGVRGARSREPGVCRHVLRLPRAPRQGRGRCDGGSGIMTPARPRNPASASGS